jgi:ATP-dependent Clp protease protease subunit
MAGSTSIRAQIRSTPQSKSAELDIFDNIDPNWGVGVVDITDHLKAAGDIESIHVRIHSNGGNALEGFAISHALAMHPASVHVEIAVLAASAASVIAMAADPGQISIAESGFVMIHDPWTVAAGNSGEMLRQAGLLDRVRSQILRSYLRHSTLSEEEISEAMSADSGAGTWYTAEEAVEAGFASTIIEGLAAPQNCILPSGDNVPEGVFNTINKTQDEELAILNDLNETLRAQRSRLEGTQGDIARLMDVHRRLEELANV